MSQMVKPFPEKLARALISLRRKIMKRTMFFVVLLASILLTACVPASVVNVTVEQNNNQQQVVVEPASCTTCAAATEPEPTPSPTAEQPAPTAVAPANTPASPTAVPEITAATPIPAPVSCTTPSIKAGETAAETEYGEYLDTTLGKRMTFTSRKVIVPAKAWNDPLSESELKSVEQTWLFVNVCVPEGMFGRVFAGGYEQGLNRFENGVLMTLQPGVYEFKIRNGEIVDTGLQQDEFAAKDLDRIVEQIKNGNFDIKNALAFFGVTADILPKIPSELVKERNVQIVSAPDPE